MKLHEFPSEFRDLISIVANDKHLPESAIERDYYIVLLLKNLADSVPIFSRHMLSRMMKRQKPKTGPSS